ncbi:hypothetical protein CYY_002957 [Polysphondylium violaceum]|uniref:Uncharacterized protein n=1 Tax=Polysphondylium violaceum TaxID=133409 RepID=A0A8J4PXZ6_9MYCE|nr:hypothetical protein CYY_002957 [Polysphondylium violaceum]
MQDKLNSNNYNSIIKNLEQDNERLQQENRELKLQLEKYSTKKPNNSNNDKNKMNLNNSNNSIIKNLEQDNERLQKENWNYIKAGCSNRDHIKLILELDSSKYKLNDSILKDIQSYKVLSKLKNNETFLEDVYSQLEKDREIRDQYQILLDKYKILQKKYETLHED